MTNKELLDICNAEIEQTRIAKRMWETKTIPSHIDSDKYIRFLRGTKKQLEILEILKPFLKKVLEINEDGTEVFFKAVRYFNGYIEDINGNWNETEQIKKNKKLKEWLNEG